MAPISGGRSQAMFGFTSTTSPAATKRPIPPSASIAARTIGAIAPPAAITAPGRAGSAATSRREIVSGAPRPDQRPRERSPNAASTPAPPRISPACARRRS
ncbi:MAG: hypothetical protein MUC67_08610, partial [Acidobacteria bacterium]|nr:hypothetical protein [Acidobacteriota bacterium]